MKYIIAAVILAAAATSVAAEPQSTWDVTGIELGMTPAQVGPLLQARKFQYYKEYTEALARSNGVAIPGSQFLAAIKTATPVGGYHDYTEAYEAFFSPPIDGQSRLFKLIHYVHLADGHELLQASLNASLLEKYGKPAGSSYAGVMEWNQRGSPCTGFGREAPGYRPNVTGPQYPNQHIPIGAGLFRDNSGGSFEQNLSCGDTLVISGNIKQGNPSPPPDRALIDQYTAILYSPTLGEKAFAAAQATVSAAQNGAAQAAAEQAESNKPTL
jgi:hypothetical protein